MQVLHCGPSPRVRGKPRRGPYPVRCHGSIPACAGETHGQREDHARLRVHPRVCGGNGTAWDTAAWDTGPSPRVRGKPLVYGCVSHRRRSIPACAGETAASCPAAAVSTVHPRVCGGNIGGPSFRLFWTGPSPRVRGKPRTWLLERSVAGSIPACAGETARMTELSSKPMVHPRVCGGNRLARHRSLSVVGPSPRVRGKPGCGLDTRVGSGSIPACAGETSTDGTDACRKSVHPRVCGGNSKQKAKIVNAVALA